MAIYLAAGWTVAIRRPAPAEARLLFPVATALMHLGYGCGTISGVLALPWLARRAREGADPRTPRRVGRPNHERRGYETSSEHP